MMRSVQRLAWLHPPPTWHGSVGGSIRAVQQATAVGQELCHVVLTHQLLDSMAAVCHDTSQERRRSCWPTTAAVSLPPGSRRGLSAVIALKDRSEKQRCKVGVEVFEAACLRMLI